MTDDEQLANDLYVAVVQPDTIWWDDLTPEMQEGWLRAARVARKAIASDGLYIGPIQHSPGLCARTPCDCWCRACQQHNERPPARRRRTKGFQPMVDGVDYDSSEQ